MSSLTGQGKDYFEFVKSIGESKSKQEEDRIISEEIIHLKKAFNQSGLTKKKMKELVIRSLYVEMLGQDASFAYIRAVELCASTAITQKKVGYLAASLCLSPQHEFRFMLVNQIQRDMKSTNLLEICAALNAISKIVTEDMIPAVITDVVNLLKHDMDLVRKRAVCALHRFYQMDKRVLLDHVDEIRRTLCDKDPSVMAATLPLFHAMISDDVMQFKDLVSSFVSILKQIIEHRLPRDFDYHRIPSPWIQMSILRILAVLGKGDQQSSEGMYEVLVDAMKRADTGINVGYAIVYECVKTITSIYPNTMLMDAAATSISRFIRSDSHNLKYVGIRGLAAIVKEHPKYAADHQMAVIDCLEDPDETLKRKTLDLLFRMTNAVNVEFIVEKLLTFLQTSTDDHFRADLVQQITQCAERFAPSNTWYVQTIIRVFELAGDKVKGTVAQTLIQLIAEGAEFEDDDENVADAKDDELRTEAVEHFLILLEKPKLPAILAQTMAWVLGEYGYLSTTCSKEVIMNKLCDLAHQAFESETKSSCITALSKLIAQSGHCPSRVLQLITFYSQSKCLDLQQRCIEVLALLKISDIMADVLPVDASCEDIEIDDHLSFLNQFVQMSLNLGARPYDPPQEFLKMLEDDGSERKASLKITPYEVPKIPAPVNVAIAAPVPSASTLTSLPGAPSVSSLSSQQGPLSIATAQGNQLINTRGVQAVWGKKPEPPPAPVPAPVAEPVHQPTVAPVTPTNTNPTLNNVPNGQWGGNPVSQPPPQPIPEVPKVLTEKEKMAHALFGGISSSKPVANAASKRRASNIGAATAPTTYSPPSATPAAPAPAPPSASVDLFHDMTTSATSVSKPVQAAPVASSSNELLDLMSDYSSTPTHPQSTPLPPVPTVPTQSNNGFGSHPNHANDLLAGLSVAPNHAPVAFSPPPVPPVPASSSAQLISDVFGNIDLSGGASTPTPAQSENVKPFAINTAEFGRRWGSTPVESKQSVSGASLSRLDLETLRRAMPTNYHHVESIGQTLESIFAATATNIGAVILVHAKLNGPRRTVDVTVKSSSSEICQREIGSISQALSSFRG